MPCSTVVDAGAHTDGTTVEYYHHHHLPTACACQAACATSPACREQPATACHRLPPLLPLLPCQWLYIAVGEPEYIILPSNGRCASEFIN